MASLVISSPPRSYRSASREEPVGTAADFADAQNETLQRVREACAQNLDVTGYRDPHPTTGRWRLKVDGSAQDVQAVVARLPAEVAVEPTLPRRLAVVSGHRMQQSLTPGGGELPVAGFGGMITARVTSGGRPVVNAEASLSLADRFGGPQTLIPERTDADGRVVFHYDSSLWLPTLLILEPASGCWGRWQVSPGAELAIDLPELPKTGPLGWWHFACGVTQRRSDRGAGIRIGVVDSGFGPHPYLSHLRGLGSVIGAHFDGGPAAALDPIGHGTHICGILAARPDEGSKDYAGLAEGADVVVIRVFPPQGDANQGDIAEAVERLAAEEVDIINLSLGGSRPSEIERDAMRLAAMSGALCIGAAGNQFGQPVIYPAAYPEVAAVSAIGLIGAYPADTLESQSLPSALDHYAYNSLFIGNFSNVGPEMTCTAPGVGIISTAPPGPDAAAPYAVKSGTSMAAPLAVAALASVLAADQTYQSLPRTQARAQRAAALLATSVWPLGLNPIYAGVGLSQGVG